MKHFDISINGSGPVLRRVEAEDFAGAAAAFALDPAQFTETTPGVWEGGAFVVQSLDAEPFHVATADLEELVAALEATDERGESLAQRSPALARIASRARLAVDAGRRKAR
jgi:hypothetical protein